MRLTTAAICAAALAITALPADAAKKKPVPCAGLQDPRGDGTFRAAPGFEYTDVVAGEVAWSSREVVASIRVAGSPSAAPAGFRWDYRIVIRGVPHDFAAEIDGSGAARSSVTVGDASMSHAFQFVGDLLTWRLKRSDVRLGGVTMDLAAKTTFVTTADTAEARLVRRADGKWCAVPK